MYLNYHFIKGNNTHYYMTYREALELKNRIKTDNTYAIDTIFKEVATELYEKDEKYLKEYGKTSITYEGWDYIYFEYEPIIHNEKKIIARFKEWNSSYSNNPNGDTAKTIDVPPAPTESIFPRVYTYNYTSSNQTLYAPTIDGYVYKRMQKDYGNCYADQSIVIGYNSDFDIVTFWYEKVEEEIPTPPTPPVTPGEGEDV